MKLVFIREISDKVTTEVALKEHDHQVMEDLFLDDDTNVVDSLNDSGLDSDSLNRIEYLFQEADLMKVLADICKLDDSAVFIMNIRPRVIAFSIIYYAKFGPTMSEDWLFHSRIKTMSRDMIFNLRDETNTSGVYEIKFVYVEEV